LTTFKLLHNVIIYGDVQRHLRQFQNTILHNVF